MRKLITALGATATVIAGSLVGTATAMTVTGVGSLPSLTKNSSPVANVELHFLGAATGLTSGPDSSATIRPGVCPVLCD